MKGEIVLIYDFHLGCICFETASGDDKLFALLVYAALLDGNPSRSFLRRSQLHLYTFVRLSPRRLARSAIFSASQFASRWYSYSRTRIYEAFKWHLVSFFSSLIGGLFPAV